MSGTFLRTYELCTNTCPFYNSKRLRSTCTITISEVLVYARVDHGPSSLQTVDCVCNLLHSMLRSTFAISFDGSI